MSKKLTRPLKAAIGVLAALVVFALIGVIWWNQRDEGPEAVNLQTAVEQLAAANLGDADDTEDGSDDSKDGDASAVGSGAADGSGAGADSGSDPVSADASGSEASSDASSSDASGSDTETPGVDPSDEDPEAPDPSATAPSLAGEWTVESAESGTDVTGEPAISFAGFRVDEVLAAGIGDFTAVGRTADVSGSVTLDEAALLAATVEVDFRTLRTDDPRRDFRIQQALDTQQHPTASFLLTAPLTIPPSAAAGEPFAGSAEGELTIKGVTHEDVFELEAQLVGDKIVVVGSSEVLFSDYGVEAPTAPIVVSVEDHGIMEFQLILSR